MRKAFFLLTFSILCFKPSFGQVIAPPGGAVPPKPVDSSPLKTELDPKEWGNIVKALDDEDWAWSSTLIRSSMTKLAADNEKKQLAQLRYFLLYSLAGKASKNPLAYTELEKALSELTDKEFLFPARQVRLDCARSVNQICPVKSTELAVRMTATNKSLTLIHAFEYVELPNAFNIRANNGRKAYISACLKKAELNPKKQDSWIMRLYFNGGEINLMTLN